MDQAREDWSPHSAHWGAFSARWNGATLDIRPYAEDPAPSSILQNFTTAMRHKARILRPMVRKAWLDRNASSERTFDQKFVACPWDEVLDLLANELSRIRTEHGADRGLWRLLWLVQRRTFPPRAEPGSSLPQHGVRRLCAFGEQLQRRRLGRDPAACPRKLRRRLAPKRDVGPGCRTYRYGAGLRRHGVEELGRRQRRHQPPYRARRDAESRAPRRRVLRHLAAAR